MSGVQEVSPPKRTPGHTILYLAGEDTDADRHNISLIARITERSTTPVQAEILYFRPLRLREWILDGNIRYKRLRSASEFALAERVIASRTEIIIFLNYTVLLHHDDLWRLLGFSQREPYVIVQPVKTLRNRDENTWSFALRSARNDLTLYTGVITGAPAILSLNHNLLPKKKASGTRRLTALKFYSDLLKAEDPIRPLLLKGRSYLLAQPAKWLSTLAATARAYRIWRNERRFPYWFSYRSPLFHVAQLASYCALLVLPASRGGSLLLAAFAIAISAPFFFRGWLRGLFLTPRKIRQIQDSLQRIAARLLLYLIG